jgi:sensor domain CHASE-containing protein
MALSIRLPPNLRRALLGAGAPILALVVLALTGALTLFTHFARQQDEAYVASSRQLVANTLGERQRAIGDLALDFASWNDAYQLISVRWNQGWIESNYYSGVADGLIVFRRDGAVRYAWISDGLDDEDGRLAHSVAHTAASLPRLDALSGAATSADTVASSIVRLNGRFALMSVAPIAPESDAERMARLAHAEVDYLATIDMLDDDQVEAIGSQLDLAEFAIATTADESGRYVSLALPGADGVSVGVARWLDRRPGSANLSTQLGVDPAPSTASALSYRTGRKIGGKSCLGSVTRRRRSSRSCDKWKCLRRRVHRSPTAPRRSASRRRPTSAGVRSLAA